MDKVAWEFYTKRTGRSLESILSDVYDLDEAKSIIDNMGLTLPSDEVLNGVINFNTEKRAEKKRKAEEALIVKSKPTTPRRSQKKAKKTKQPAKKTAAKKTTTSKKDNKQDVEQEKPEKLKNEKYFRRVITPKS